MHDWKGWPVGEFMSVRALLKKSDILMIYAQLICSGAQAFCIGVNHLFHQNPYKSTSL